MKGAWIFGVMGLVSVTPVLSHTTPIEVRVEVAEIDHTKASSLGVDWFDLISVVEQVPQQVPGIGIFERTTAIQGDVHMLVEEGAAEILANPNLVTDSGTTASFQAGGQIPYVTTSQLGSADVEFKPYGVVLKIEPTLVRDGSIEMKVRASISSPDATHGVVISGTSVPALFEREVESHVTVRPGTTVTLAGLVQTHKEDVVSGVPVLRRIPWVGALFRWRKTNYRRTTIVMFLTPNVVVF